MRAMPDIDRLKALRRDLLGLHKTLVDAERAGYERAHGRATSAGEMLTLLIEHPWFAWLRPLSALIVRIDETLDGEESPTEAEIRALREAARALLGPAEGTPALGDRYRATIQAEPSVALAHGRVMTRLAGEAGPERGASAC